MSEIHSLQGYTRYIWSKSFRRNHPFYDEYAFDIHPHDVSVPYGNLEIDRLLNQLSDDSLSSKTRILILRCINDKLADQEYKCNLVKHDVASVIIKSLHCDCSKYDNVVLPQNKFDLPDDELSLELLVIEESIHIIAQICSVMIGRTASASVNAPRALNNILLGMSSWHLIHAVSLAFYSLTCSRDGQLIFIDQGSAAAVAKFLAQKLNPSESGDLPLLQDSYLPQNDATGSSNYPTISLIYLTTSLGETSKHSDGLRSCLGIGLIKPVCQSLNALTDLNVSARSDPAMRQFLSLSSFPPSIVSGSDGSLNSPSNSHLLLRALLDLCIRFSIHPDGRSEAGGFAVQVLCKVIQTFVEDNLIFERVRRRAVRTASKQLRRGIRSPPRSSKNSSERERESPFSCIPVPCVGSAARALSFFLISLRSKQSLLAYVDEENAKCAELNMNDTRKKGDPIEELCNDGQSQSSLFAELTEEDIEEEKFERLISKDALASLLWAADQIERLLPVVLPSDSENRHNSEQFSMSNVDQIRMSGLDAKLAIIQALEAAGEHDVLRAKIMNWSVDLNGTPNIGVLKFNIRADT